MFRKPPFFRRRTAAARTGSPAADGCRPSGAARGRHGAGGKGLTVPAAGRRTGQGKRHGGGAADGRQGRTGRQAAPALPRRGGTGRKGERGRADGVCRAWITSGGKYGANRGPGTPLRGFKGACAARLHGCELGKRKAPHGAGLVRLTGRRGIMPGAGAAAGAGSTFPHLWDHVTYKEPQAW